MNQTQIERIGEELYFIAASPMSRRLRTQAELLSQTDVPLLITGERGCGKETVARLIHSLSIRSSFPFVLVDCNALTSDLFESEFFGSEHDRTNLAARPKPDSLEQGTKGTILLRDIDAMPASAQLRLLKALQSRECVRFEGSSGIRADARTMATACGDLGKAVAEGRLNEDLYFHLSAFELEVPPLRDRRDEIPLFVGHFMNRLTRRYAVAPPTYSTEFLESCKQHSWLGNLHQLEVFIKRFLVFGDEQSALEELRLQPSIDPGGEGHNGKANGNGTAGSQPPDEKSPLKLVARHAKGEAERNAIAHALEETRWNRKAAARALSISYRALLYKIEEYHLSPQHSFSVSEPRSRMGN